MRKIINPDPRNVWFFTTLVIVCAFWIVLKDAYLLFPAMGLFGGLLALADHRRKEIKKSIEQKIISDLPLLLKNGSKISNELIWAFAASITNLIKDDKE